MIARAMAASRGYSGAPAKVNASASRALGHEVDERGAVRKRSRDLVRVDVARKIQAEMDDGNVVNRQHARIGQVDGLAAHLHRELRSADDGRADALARLDDRDRYPRLELRDDLVGQQLGDVAVTGGFATEDVFGDSAGETDEVRLDLVRASGSVNSSARPSSSSGAPAI